MKDEGTGSVGCGNTHAKKKEGTGKEEAGESQYFSSRSHPRMPHSELGCAAAFPG